MTGSREHPSADNDSGSRLAEAFRVVAGDDSATAGLPLADPAITTVGTLDKRVILQTDIWIDRQTERHRLGDMRRCYRANVLGFLRRQEHTWVLDATAWEIAEAVHHIAAAPVAREHLELLDLLTPGWTGHTPLGRRLHQLNHTRPGPLRAPPPRLTCAETDFPEVLRDEDAGCWQVTTRSGAVYVLDLDQRRVMRLSVAGNGNGLRPPVPKRVHDAAWTDLDYLIWCRTGSVLVVLGRGPTAQTPSVITAIQRLPPGD